MLLPRFFKDFFKSQISQSYFQKIVENYDNLKQNNILFPTEDLIFNCFNFFDVDKLEVVIIGQDPYYIEGYANGLAFAVNSNQPIPKSLQNIFKEIKNEFGIIHTDKTLISWEKQGVLLLNTSLCVIKNQPNSCKDMGWDIFVKNFILYCNVHCSNLVYMLWGNNAKSFGCFVNQNNNLVLTSSHPSPLSVINFFHNNHFLLCNRYLSIHKKKEISW